MASSQPHPSSYRDPSGFLFFHEGALYRQINKTFAEAFEQFQQCGLSQQLVSKGLLTPYEIINQNLSGRDDWYQTIKPEFIPFISYPYEWCFDMLKDAALTTLELAVEAMPYKMMLKDASAYNLQWHGGRMQFIDTLSFEPYNEKQPWIAYRQFCEQFLTPLALMHYLKMPLQPLQLSYPDGIPLSLTKKLLPVKSKLNLYIYLHLHLQANLSKKNVNTDIKEPAFSKKKMLQLLKSLQQTAGSFSLNKPSGVWSAYYEEASQRQDYLSQKKELVARWISKMNVQTAFDAGANEGGFSFLLAEKGIRTISADFDHYSINNLYKELKTKGIKDIHPVVADLSNPSPAMGVNNQERASLLERVNCDLVLALALIHHLAIGKNIDFEKIAGLFSSLGKNLIIEFVPKTDEKIKLMLQHKPDIYNWYTKDAFLAAFGLRYKIIEEKEIGISGRTLYLMEALKPS